MIGVVKMLPAEDGEAKDVLERGEDDANELVVGC